MKYWAVLGIALLLFNNSILPWHIRGMVVFIVWPEQKGIFFISMVTTQYSILFIELILTIKSVWVLFIWIHTFFRWRVSFFVRLFVFFEGIVIFFVWILSRIIVSMSGIFMVVDRWQFIDRRSHWITKKVFCDHGSYWKLLKSSNKKIRLCNCIIWNLVNLLTM